MTNLGGLALVLVAGCTGAQAAGPAGPHGQSRSMDISKAGLPYKVLRAHGGAEVPVEEFYAALAAADAVCIGETHTNPHHHWLQLEILERLSKDGGSGALGMEMFQRPFQGVLDDHAAGKIDETAMLSRTGWKERWGYDWSLYQPMVRLAVDRKLALLALNAARELTKKVAHDGLESLSPDDRKQLPELDLGNADHKAFFTEATSGHEMPQANMDNFYTAQVIWDETMAETASAWLAGAPGRKIIVLAGEGHCIDPAIPGRMRRRGVPTTVAVQPVLDDGSSAVADALVTPRVDFLVVLDATP